MSLYFCMALVCDSCGNVVPLWWLVISKPFTNHSFIQAISIAPLQGLLRGAPDRARKVSIQPKRHHVPQFGLWCNLSILLGNYDTIGRKLIRMISDFIGLTCKAIYGWQHSQHQHIRRCHVPVMPCMALRGHVDRAGRFPLSGVHWNTTPAQPDCVK